MTGTSQKTYLPNFRITPAGNQVKQLESDSATGIIFLIRYGIGVNLPTIHIGFYSIELGLSIIHEATATTMQNAAMPAKEVCNP